MQFVKDILHNTGAGRILTKYEKKKYLNEQDKREIVRNVAKKMVKWNQGNHPTPRQKRRAANAIRGCFPLVYPEVDVLIGRNSRTGKLGFAFNNAVIAYEKKRESSSSSDDDQDEAMEVDVNEGGEDDEDDNEDDDEGDDESDDEGDEEGDEEDDDEDIDQENSNQAVPIVNVRENPGITFLRSAVVTPSSRVVIQRYLNETRTLRQDAMLKGNTDLVFDIFAQEPRFVLYEFEQEHFEITDNLSANLSKFVRFIEDLSKSTKRNLQLVEVDTTETKPFQHLIVLLGRPAAGGAAEASSSLVTKIHGQASAIQVDNLCNDKNFPFIIIKESNPLQYFINMDGAAIPLHPGHFGTFASSFDLLFKWFFVFNLEFPKQLKKFYDFFSAAIFKLPTNLSYSPTTMEIVRRFEKFESDDSEEGSEEEST